MSEVNATDFCFLLGREFSSIGFTDVLSMTGVVSKPSCQGFETKWMFKGVILSWSRKYLMMGESQFSVNGKNNKC